MFKVPAAVFLGIDQVPLIVRIPGTVAGLKERRARIGDAEGTVDRSVSRHHPAKQHRGQMPPS